MLSFVQAVKIHCLVKPKQRQKPIYKELIRPTLASEARRVLGLITGLSWDL